MTTAEHAPQRASDPSKVGAVLTTLATEAAMVTLQQPASDLFDLAALRLSQDFAGGGVKKQLIKIPVRRPHRQEFIRVHPGDEYRLDTAVLELKEEREVYLVAPELRAELVAEIAPARLFTAINRQGVVFIWPVKLPGQDGRLNPWHDTALQAAELAMDKWLKVVADMSLGGYQPYIAAGDLPDPEWPEHPFGELLRIAFGQQYVDRPDHAVVRRLRGLA